MKVVLILMLVAMAAMGAQGSSLAGIPMAKCSLAQYERVLDCLGDVSVADPEQCDAAQTRFDKGLECVDRHCSGLDCEGTEKALKDTPELYASCDINFTCPISWTFLAIYVSSGFFGLIFLFVGVKCFLRRRAAKKEKAAVANQADEP